MVYRQWSVVCRQLSIVNRQLSVVYRQLSIVCHQSSIVSGLSSIVSCLSSIVSCLSSVVYHQLSIVNRQLSIIFRQSSVVCRPTRNVSHVLLVHRVAWSSMLQLIFILHLSSSNCHVYVGHWLTVVACWHRTCLILRCDVVTSLLKSVTPANILHRALLLVRGCS